MLVGDSRQARRKTGVTVSNHDFKAFPVMTIGKRNDMQKGFSSFQIGDLHFWDKYVYGIPYQSIGT